MLPSLAELVQKNSPDTLVSLDVFDQGKWIETLECRINLVCALVVVKGNRSEDLADLLAGRIDAEDLRRAQKILNSLSSSPLIDVGRILRDSKYACQIQDILKPETVEHAVKLFQGQLVLLSLNSSGCRIVQKLLDIGSNEVRRSIMFPELSVRILDLCVDVNGNHVVQKFIDVAPSRDCVFLVDMLRADHGSVIRLASHSYGCRVIQRLMTQCDLKDVEYIFDALCANSEAIEKLSEDVFGNYVMQQAIDYGRDIDRERIGLCFASHPDIVRLGCSKYASNVVEKAIRYHNKRKNGSAIVTKLMLNAILASNDPITGEPGLLTLMKDRYGNYVVRAMVELTSVEFARETALVRTVISENSLLLKKFTFSWHLVERLEKLNSSTEIGPED